VQAIDGHLCILVELVVDLGSQLTRETTKEGTGVAGVGDVCARDLLRDCVVGLCDDCAKH
jgi:hypothetical protein